MSTHADVANVNVGADFTTTVVQQDPLTVVVGPNVAEVAVPGPQGPPGLQNVFVQPTDPSAGWGAGQTNFIWIQT